MSAKIAQRQTGAECRTLSAKTQQVVVIVYPKFGLLTLCFPPVPPPPSLCRSRNPTVSLHGHVHEVAQEQVGLRVEDRLVVALGQILVKDFLNDCTGDTHLPSHRFLGKMSLADIC